GTTRTSPPPIPKLDFKVQRIGGKLSYLGHVLMENRNRLLVQTMVTEANGTAERDAAMLMAEKLPGVKRVTLGADKNYDTKEFVRELRRMNILPMWPRTTVIGPAPSTSARPSMLATRSVSASENESRSRSAG